MVPHHFFYQLALFVLVWLFVMLYVTWSKPGLTTPTRASSAQAQTLQRAQTVCGPNGVPAVTEQKTPILYK